MRKYQKWYVLYFFNGACTTAFLYVWYKKKKNAGGGEKDMGAFEKLKT